MMIMTSPPQMVLVLVLLQMQVQLCQVRRFPETGFRGRSGDAAFKQGRCGMARSYARLT